mmetsp:Transcript_57475/g.145727  ORF Transcript_57475/g.145727 Transcript_57475/m.145727 type:complete len:253 (+) Transcript_57475:103-861(+)|eukprot:CAMPEP_0183440998 /NCGR_PEP_ID=MMETSP0370-20130417/83402_1 /TAXON_ID=268820 /ORGANISM="Peridinium aciculiferum, Strain PAER-2" /LENGTH=252 /DNA_ID=CAMNT_0025630063 /DNA_START=76 /DNA_END=834 /DNA_ORIENTATION=+
MATVAVFSTCIDAPGAFDFMSLDHVGGRLNDVFASQNDRLLQWRKERSQALHQEGQRALRELQAERRALEQLEDGVRESAGRQQEVANVRERGAKVGQAVREGLEAMAKRSEAAAKARDKFRALEEKRVEDIRKEEQALAEQSAAAAKRLAEVDGFLGLFKARLGLELTRVAPQTVRFALTLIDEADLDAEFSFVLSVGAVYQVPACKPQLPQRRLEALLGRLNHAGPSEAAALPAFVCGMRQSFQELAAHS